MAGKMMKLNGKCFLSPFYRKKQDFSMLFRPKLHFKFNNHLAHGQSFFQKHLILEFAKDIILCILFAIDKSLVGSIIVISIDCHNEPFRTMMPKIPMFQDQR